MRRGRAALAADDEEVALREIDLVPAQRDKLAYSECVPVGEQDHRLIAMAVTTAPPGCFAQQFDFVLGEVFAGAALTVRLPARRGGPLMCPADDAKRYCPIFRVWHVRFRSSGPANMVGCGLVTVPRSVINGTVYDAKKEAIVVNIRGCVPLMLRDELPILRRMCGAAAPGAATDGRSSLTTYARALGAVRGQAGSGPSGPYLRVYL